MLGQLRKGREHLRKTCYEPEPLVYLEVSVLNAVVKGRREQELASGGLVSSCCNAFNLEPLLRRNSYGGAYKLIKLPTRRPKLFKIFSTLVPGLEIVQHTPSARTRACLSSSFFSPKTCSSPLSLRAISLPQNRRHGGPTVSANARAAAQVLVLTFATSNPPAVLLYIILPRRT